MKVWQHVIKAGTNDISGVPDEASASTLVLVFGPTDRLSNSNLLPQIAKSFPKAKIVGCSTSSPITRDGSFDNFITVTAILFESSTLRVQHSTIDDKNNSLSVGTAIGKALQAEDLRHIIVLSNGLKVNGSDLLRGIQQIIGNAIAISGGLASDGPRLQKTLIINGEQAEENGVVGIGLYGKNLRVSTALGCGWVPFGNHRTITRSEGNVVYEIDGTRALDVYSNYLGDEAKKLPSSGLIYPLAICTGHEEEVYLIRSIQAIDRDQGSVTFAGNVPQGCTVRLMHAQYHQLADGARQSVQQVAATNPSPTLAILISSFGRKVLMGRSGDLEIETAAEGFANMPVFTGFYSYGEIGRFGKSAASELLNQTIGITAISEQQ